MNRLSCSSNQNIINVAKPSTLCLAMLSGLCCSELTTLMFELPASVEPFGVSFTHLLRPQILSCFCDFLSCCPD